jgi:hypothetical protein
MGSNEKVKKMVKERFSGPVVDFYDAVRHVAQMEKGQGEEDH